MQDGWKAWKKALKQSNELDDNGYEDDAARSAAQMVADAHKKFAAKAGGKGKKNKGDEDEAEAEPFSVLHKVRDTFSAQGDCNFAPTYLIVIRQNWLMNTSLFPAQSIYWIPGYCFKQKQ